MNENTCYDCEEFETQGNVKGRDYAVVWKKDKSGRDYEWDKVLVLGSILNIKHTSDGGYIAVGLSHSSRKLNGAPLFYNPDVNGTLNDFNCSNGIEWESNPCDSQDPRDTRRFGYACKLNHDGDIEWEALFGTSDHALVENDSYNTFSSMIWDVVETSSGFVLVGESDVRNSQGYAINGGNTTNNWRSAAMWMVNKDGEIFIDNGQLQLGFLPDYFTSRGIASGLAVYNSSIDSEEKVVVSGFREVNCPTPINSQRKVFVAQFNNANLFPQTTGDYEWVVDGATINASLCGQNNLTWDVEINKNIPEQIILPVLYDCGTGGGGPNNSCAEARVYRLDAASGVYINHVDFGHVETYDLKIAVSVKPDGGFAMVSTRRNNPPVPSVYCGSPQRQIITVSWGASAYIGCVDPNDNILWATTIDRNNEQAATYNSFPADMKKMECVYSISQAPDGGYVVAGNNSDNFDDFYMVKLFSDCEADHNLYDNYSTSEANNFTEEITTNTTWSTDRTLLGSVHIKNGAKLTINSAAVIKFADSKRLARADGTNIITNLVVEPGGQLELLDDATLDAANNCSNSMWDGVQVWGNPFLPQTIANQGYMVMNDGNIKNARIGISAAKYDYDLYANQHETFTGGGGLIRVSYSTIENCRKSAYLGPYPLPLGLNAYWNKSFFSNTTFACNQPMRDYLYQIPGSSTQNFGVNEHLSIYGTNGVLITHSYFSNTASGLDLDQRGNGIHTAEASARITNGCEFTSLNKAVHAQFAAFMNGINVDGGNKFIDNRQSILLEGGLGSRIAGNEFDIPEDAAGAQLPFGVLTVNAEGFAIENNQFAGANNTGAPNFGVVVNNSGALNTGADVRNNGFAGLYVGTSTIYNNDALRISCNNYSDYRYAWLISLFGSGTLGDQGTGCDLLTQKRAGNLFFDNDTETEENIWNNAPPFLYYAWGYPSETDPTNYSINDVSLSLQNGEIQNCNGGIIVDDVSCSQEEPCTDPDCIELLQQRLSGISDQQQWMSLYNEIARYYIHNDSTGINDTYFAFLESVSDSSYGILRTLATEAIKTGKFTYADSVIDEIDNKLDDSCLTSIDRLILTMLTDSSGINQLSESYWSLYQACLSQSNPANYRYEILEDIIELIDHPRELILGELGRLKAPLNAEASLTPLLGSKNNPGSGLFEIYSLSTTPIVDRTAFDVYNSYGQVVISGITSLENKVYNLNLTSMPAGVYTFVLYGKEVKGVYAKIRLIKL